MLNNNLSFKIIIFCAIFLSLAFFITKNAAAAETCGWTTVVTSGMSTDRSTDKCNGLGTPVEDSRCPQPKPADPIGGYKICCCTQEVVPPPKPKFVIPDLQISIPGLTFTPTSTVIKDWDEETGEYDVSIPWLGEYLKAIYDYSVSIAGILAALILMAGGILWLISGGDASKITQAKELIIGSITGLIILMCSYIILYQINPNLTRFRSITISGIARAELSPGPEGTGSVNIDTDATAQILGVQCGTDSVAEIINKSKGKVTYSNDLRGTSAPAAKMYFDCSSFAKFVLQCALNKSSASYSGDIFKDQNTWNMDIDKLQPGDLIGWTPNNSPTGYGHVLIYMGNGQFGDCNGHDKSPGKCIGNKFTLESIKKYATKLNDGKIYFKRY